MGAAPANAQKATALLCRPPIHPDVGPNEEYRGTEPKQDRPQRAALFVDRLSADLHTVLDQKRLEAGIHEGGQDGLEGAHLARLGIILRARCGAGCRS